MYLVYLYTVMLVMGGVVIDLSAQPFLFIFEFYCSVVLTHLCKLCSFLLNGAQQCRAVLALSLLLI